MLPLPRLDGSLYLLNLVDTPGHADFAHEVRRSLAACDGALLLVDASQGVEAQTLKVADAAKQAGVPLLAACSKVDLPTANAIDVALDVASSAGRDGTRRSRAFLRVFFARSP